MGLPLPRCKVFHRQDQRVRFPGPCSVSGTEPGIQRKDQAKRQQTFLCRWRASCQTGPRIGLRLRCTRSGRAVRVGRKPCSSSPGKGEVGWGSGPGEMVSFVQPAFVSGVHDCACWSARRGCSGRVRAGGSVTSSPSTPTQPPPFWERRHKPLREGLLRWTPDRVPFRCTRPGIALIPADNEARVAPDPSRC